MSLLTSSPAFLNFYNSIDSKSTRRCYKYSLSMFMKYCGIPLQDYDSILLYKQPQLEDKIRDYIIYLKVDKGLSSNTINLYVAAIAHFYAMNNVTLNWKRLSKFKNKKRLVVEDRPYSKEQIRSLLDFADLRSKCIILLMCSSGLRRGGLPGLRIGDLERIDKYGLYKIHVYKKEQEAYTTYCTPECAKHLDQYFEYRARLGEPIHSKSPVIRKEFNSLDVAKPRPLAVDSISWLMNKLLDESGIRPRSADRYHKTELMQCHGLRKAFETTARLAGMDLVMINRCMGHSSGLEDSYLKLSDEQVLEGNDHMIGYAGVINALTINSEFVLKTRITELEQKNNEVEELRQELSEMRENNNEILQLLRSPKDLLKLVEDQ